MKMYEQLLLFKEQNSAWVERIWGTIDQDKRQEIVTILAQMGKDAMANRITRELREETDEPN